MSAESSTRRPEGRQLRLRRAFVATAASLSLLVTVVSSVAMGAYFWTRSQIRTIREPGGSGTPQYTGKCARASCNYLLLGSDSRTGLSEEEQVQFGTDQDIGGSNRSDTIIVVHT
ncbi:MAG TPA: hypothetical protein VF382_06560, partial [Actinomycetota bacterium]